MYNQGLILEEAVISGLLFESFALFG